MSRGRRFFIFFMSAGMMAILIGFSLQGRGDNFSEKFFGWLPNNRVKQAIFEKPIAESADVLCTMKCLNIGRQELYMGLKDGDVEFSHDDTQVKEHPKSYRVEILIGTKEYASQVDLYNRKTYIKSLKLIEGELDCDCEKSEED